MAVRVQKVSPFGESERDPVPDSGVYRIRAAEVHATGLRLPSHMEMLNDGRILVSEFGGGRVRDITEPGDYTDQSKGQHAWGLKNPGGIMPLSDGRVVVGDSGSGTILRYH